MQKMLYIFLSKCSCGKLFSAARFIAAAGNAYQYWLSAPLPGNKRNFIFFGHQVIANPLFGMAASGVSFQESNSTTINKQGSVVAYSV